MIAPPDEQDDTEQEIDGSDEADHDAQEIALGAALATLLIAWLLPGPSMFGGRRSTAWADQLTAAIGPTLAAFIQRSAFDLAQSSRLPNASIAAARAAQSIYPVAMSRVVTWTQDTLDRLQGADPSAQDVQVAAQNIARSAAVSAKSEVRNETADKLGAVWTIWRTRHDSRVRETHRELDGQSVPFGGRFVTVTGALLRWSGDPQAPIEETAGCRCHQVWRLRPKDSSYAV